MKNRSSMGDLIVGSIHLLAIVLYVLFVIPAAGAESGVMLAATPFVSLAGACSDILVYVESIAGQNNPFMLGRKIGALDYITSPMNGGVKSQLISVDQGRKLAHARIVYKQRARPCDMVSTPVGLCTTPQTPRPKEVDVTIANYVGSKPQSFSNSDMINICQDTTSFVQDYVLSFMRAGRERVSELILADLKATVGINYQHNGSVTTTGTCVTKQIIGTVNSQKVPFFGNYSEVLLDYQNNQMNGIPVVIGDGNLWQFTQLAALACCNSAIPFDSAVMAAQSAIYIDQAASRVLTANQAIMTGFGVNHLLWFNENNNININTPIQQHIVVPDPLYPALSWDLDFVFDECTKSWIFKIGAWVDTFNIFQADSFGSDPSLTPDCHDDLEGMLGNFCYDFTAA
jgi:hypothetical protein